MQYVSRLSALLIRFARASASAAIASLLLISQTGCFDAELTWEGSDLSSSSSGKSSTGGSGSSDPSVFSARTAGAALPYINAANVTAHSFALQCPAAGTVKIQGSSLDMASVAANHAQTSIYTCTTQGEVMVTLDYTTLWVAPAIPTEGSLTLQFAFVPTDAAAQTQNATLTFQVDRVPIAIDVSTMSYSPQVNTYDPSVSSTVSYSPPGGGSYNPGPATVQNIEYAVGTGTGSDAARTTHKAWTSVGTQWSAQATGLTLTTSTSYYFSVRVTDTFGNISPAYSPSTNSFFIYMAPPSAPAFTLTSTDYQNAIITVTFAQGPDLTIQRSADGGSTWPTTVYSGANPGTYTDNTVATNASYMYRIYSTNTAGNSPTSAGQSITPRVNLVSTIEIIDTPAEAYPGTTGTYDDVRRASFWWDPADFSVESGSAITYELHIVATNYSGLNRDVYLHRSDTTDIIGMTIPDNQATGGYGYYYLTIPAASMNFTAQAVFLRIEQTPNPGEFSIDSARLVIRMPRAIRARMYYPLTSPRLADNWGEGPIVGMNAANGYDTSIAASPAWFDDSWAIMPFMRDNSQMAVTGGSFAANPWRFEATAGTCASGDTGNGNSVTVDLQALGTLSAGNLVSNILGADLSTPVDGYPAHLVKQDLAAAAIPNLTYIAPYARSASGIACLYSARISLVMENILSAVSAYRTAPYYFGSDTSKQFWAQSFYIADSTEFSNPRFDFKAIGYGPTGTNPMGSYIHGIDSVGNLSSPLNSPTLQITNTGGARTLFSTLGLGFPSGYAFHVNFIDNPDGLNGLILGQQMHVRIGQ